MAELTHDMSLDNGHICVDNELRTYTSLVCSRCVNQNVLLVIRSNTMNKVLVRSESQLWRAICDVMGIDRKTKDPVKAAKVELVRSAIFERYRQIQLKPFTEGKLKGE